MAWLSFGDTLFDADLVVFDKDGTLTDFESMWGHMTWAWLTRLTEGKGGDDALREISALIGYDADHRRTIPESPLIVASEEVLQAIAAAVLYRRGVNWSTALSRAEAARLESITATPLELAVRPTGDVVGVIQRLQAARVQLAVVTIDSRERTSKVLGLLGIADVVDSTVCGDDGVQWKPAPDMLLAVCERLHVDPGRTVVVGDTVADLLMARRGGAGLAVAVLSGGGELTSLREHADVVLNSIDEIGTADGD